MPTVAAALNTDILGISWALLAYQLSNIGLSMVFGRLGDRGLGRRKRRDSYISDARRKANIAIFVWALYKLQRNSSASIGLRNSIHAICGNCPESRSSR